MLDVFVLWGGDCALRLYRSSGPRGEEGGREGGVVKCIVFVLCSEAFSMWQVLRLVPILYFGLLLVRSRYCYLNLDLELS